MPVIDVLIAGAGMAGLSAALAAAEAGATVTVLEKGGVVGGAARLSAGVFWTYRTLAEQREHIPDGDAELQEALATGYEESLRWLDGHVVPVGPPTQSLDNQWSRVMGVGAPGRRGKFMESLWAASEKRGARLLLNRRLLSLEREESGAFVVGVDAAGKSERWQARSVILATGGYQGNRELLTRYVGSEADYLMIRSWPGCTGDGFLAGLAAGAGASRGLGSFYGHTMPAAAVPLEEYQPITPYFAGVGVLVNRYGQRFTDESVGRLEETNAAADIQQPGGRFYLILDQRIYREHVIGPGVTGRAVTAPNKFERAKALGCPTIEAPALPALAARMESEWGVNGGRLLSDLDTYNRAVEDGRGHSLIPPRIRNQQALAEPPFYAMVCIGAITLPYGGLWVNQRCQVRERSGQAIPGLYAVGVDAGGVFNRTYGGGLAWALVSGRVAGGNAGAGSAAE